MLGDDDATNGFRRPEYGSAIDKKSAAVERSGKCPLSSFLAATGAPLATTSRISNCSNKRTCITAPRSDEPEIELIIGELSRGYGGLLIEQCPLLAQSGLFEWLAARPLLGVKQTFPGTIQMMFFL